MQGRTYQCDKKWGGGTRGEEDIGHVRGKSDTLLRGDLDRSGVLGKKENRSTCAYEKRRKAINTINRGDRSKTGKKSILKTQRYDKKI